MSSNFWIGLIIGGVISFLASLFANFYTPSLSQYLARQKSWYIERNRRRAMRAYVEIFALRNNKRDRYLLFQERWNKLIITVIVIAFLLTPVFGFRMFFINRLWFAPEFVASFAIVYVTWRMFNLEILRARLDNFPAYEAKVKERWGTFDESELAMLEAERVKDEVF